MGTLAAAASGVLGAVVAASAVPSEGDRLVKATLIIEQDAVVPGSTGSLGVRLTIEPKWHVYWRNNGDSGMPVDVTFDAVPGLTIGECQWPAPMRHVSDGDLLDFVHEGEVVLLFPYSADSSLKPGQTLTLNGKASWLVCKDLCLPGEGALSLSVPVAASARAGEAAKELERARRALPRSPRADELGVRWEAETLELRVERATRLVFFPYESGEGVTPGDMLGSGDVKGDSIRLAYPAEVRRASRVRGVLEVWRDGTREHLLVDTDGPGPR